jgi:hypothetical protein
MPLYMFVHNLLNVQVQIANVMGLQKKIFSLSQMYTMCALLVLCTNVLEVSYFTYAVPIRWMLKDSDSAVSQSRVLCFWDFVHRQIFQTKLDNTPFRELGLLGSCCLEHRTIDKVQNPDCVNPVCITVSNFSKVSRNMEVPLKVITTILITKSIQTSEKRRSWHKGLSNEYGM